MKYEKESLNRYLGGQMISQSVKIKIVKYEKYLHTENIEMTVERDLESCHPNFFLELFGIWTVFVASVLKPSHAD